MADEFEEREIPRRFTEGLTERLTFNPERAINPLRLAGPIKIGTAILDPLAELPGTWTGTGFNLIWRPHFPSSPQDRFLQLNLTSETIQFFSIGAPIPNRGFVEPDIFFLGVHYLQQVSDANFPPPNGGGAMHLEPGIWLNVPGTPDTDEIPTVVRMASIPHGNALLAQGHAFDPYGSNGPPTISPASIFPFPIGDPSHPFTNFPEPDLAVPTPFRNPIPPTLTQALVNDPNSLLTDRLATQNVLRTVTLEVTTQTRGGGVENIPFLIANADAAEMTATFWIETVENPSGGTFLQLQYTQTVMLNFNGLSWPHVTVANLVKTI